MKNSENKSENATIVNGVVLTNKAIIVLETLQDENNSYLKDVRDKMNDAISHLIDSTEYVGDDRQTELSDLIKFLNYFNRQLKDLMKP